MGQLKKRLASSAIFVSISVYAIFGGPMWLFGAIVMLLVLLSLNEYLMIAEKKGTSVSRRFVLLLGAGIPLSFYFFSAKVLALVIASLALFIYNFRPRLKQGALLSTSVSMFGLIYIAWFFSHLIEMRDLAHGAAWVFYTVLIVKGGDAGAYFVGKKYGRAKLIEHISPNKSVEGAIGGFATTVLLSLMSVLYIPGVSFIHFLLLGVLTGVVSQLGDLAESLIKRDAGVKDSGVIPGLGGVLDVLDSLLLSIPCVYYYITVLAGVGR